MMSQTRSIRRYTDRPAPWPMQYGNDEFVAEGTMLDASTRGWLAVQPL